MNGSVIATDRRGRRAGVSRALMMSTVLATGMLALPALAQTSGGGTIELAPVTVEGEAIANPKSSVGAPPPAYAGGQVSRGARTGALGNRDIMDTPFSVTSYTDTLIQNQQAETLGDVLLNDPGVRVSRSFGNSGEQFVIRGLPLNGEDLLIDGLAGTAPRQITAVEMFERIEVLRGPSAFLNGIGPSSSGIGGSINLVPKRAGDAPLTRFTTTYGMDEELGGHLDIGRRFGPDGEFGIRANIVGRGGDTAVQGEEESLMLGSLGMDYRGDRFRASLDIGHQKLRIDGPRPNVQLTGDGIPAVPDADADYSQAFSYTELRETFAQTRLEYDFTPNVMGYAAFGVRDMREDGSYSNPTVNAAGIGTIGRLDVPREDNAVSGMAGMRADAQTGFVGHRLDAGFSALRTVNKNAFEFGTSAPFDLNNPTDYPKFPTSFAGGDFEDLPKVSEVNLKSIFVSDTLSVLDDRVQLTLGARHQWLQVEGFDRASGSRTDNYDESATSPVVGIVVKPTGYLSLYANRIEGLAQGPSAPSTALNFGQIFAPYEAVQYEVGAKFDFGRFGASVALFELEKPNGVLDPTTQIYGISGEQQNRGVELMMFGEPVTGIRLLGGVTFIDPELNGTAGGANDGNDAIGVPNFQANFGAEWDPAFLRGVTLASRVIHTGSQYANDANTLKLDSWTRLDIGARYTTEIDNRAVTFRANIENVTNEAYWASANGGYLVQGDPLTLKISAGIDF